MMSFGTVAPDNLGPTGDVPGLSMLTGLFGSALGYERTESDKLQALQDAVVEYGVRVDRPGRIMTDFQIVDLGLPHLQKTGWTTWGYPEEPRGSSSDAKHIRHRDYVVDASMMVAVRIESPTLTVEDVYQALQHPVNPLFIGRKSCLPSQPIAYGIVESDDVLGALRSLPSDHRITRNTAYWVPAGSDDVGAVPFRDLRDWKSRLHGGVRYMVRKFMPPQEPSCT